MAVMAITETMRTVMIRLAISRRVMDWFSMAISKEKSMFALPSDRYFTAINPNVATVGGLQSQGADGETVVGYCEALATKDLEPSGFPRRGKFSHGFMSISQHNTIFI
jgi:hypothetical protein